MVDPGDLLELSREFGFLAQWPWSAFGGLGFLLDDGDYSRGSGYLLGFPVLVRLSFVSVGLFLGFLEGVGGIGEVLVGSQGLGVKFMKHLNSKC